MGCAFSGWATPLIKIFIRARRRSEWFCTSPGRRRHGHRKRAGFGHGSGLDPCPMPVRFLTRRRTRPQEVQNNRPPSRRDTPTGRLAWMRPNSLSTARPVHQAARGRAQPSCLQYTRLSAPRLRRVLVMGMSCPAHASTMVGACCNMMMPW